MPHCKRDMYNVTVSYIDWLIFDSSDQPVIPNRGLEDMLEGNHEHLQIMYS
jgi:hypothetical protein